MATRRPFWKWPRWKSIGFCLWPPSTCIWSLKLKFQSKLDLHPGNLVTYRVQKPKNLIWPPGESQVFFAVSGLWLLGKISGFHLIIHKVWSGIEEGPMIVLSSVKFLGHKGLFCTGKWANCTPRNDPYSFIFMGNFIKGGILHTLKFHLHTLSCHFWLNLCIRDMKIR